MRDFVLQLRELTHFADTVFVAFGVVGLALMTTAALVRMPDDEVKRRRTSIVVTVVGLAGAAFVCAAALAFTQVAGRPTAPSGFAVGRAIFGDILGRMLLGALVALAVPCAAIVATRGARWSERIALILVAAPLIVAALAVTTDALAEWKLLDDQSLDVAGRGAVIGDFVRHLGALGPAAMMVPVVACVALVVVLGASGKRRTSWAEVAFAAAALALGALAFAGTRGLAYDARHPIPHDDDRISASWAPQGPLPLRDPALPCRDLESPLPPIFSFRGTVPTLENRPTDASHLDADLADTAADWADFTPGVAPRGLLYVIRGDAERQLPIATVLASAPRNGFAHVQALAHDETTFHSRTRGDLVLRSACAQTLVP